MKTKEEILKMTAKELNEYKWSSDLDIKSSHCYNCYDCSDCYKCRNLFKEEKYQYMICNVQFSKEEYEAKMKELNI